MSLCLTLMAQVMPGDSNRAVLPMPLSCRYIGRDFSRMEQNMTVRLSAPLATDATLCTLDLAFDAATPDAVVEKLPVRVNAEVVARLESDAAFGHVVFGRNATILRPLKDPFGDILRSAALLL